MTDRPTSEFVSASPTAVERDSVPGRRRLLMWLAVALVAGALALGIVLTLRARSVAEVTITHVLLGRRSNRRAKIPST